MLRATLTRSDPKEFLFFNRDDTGEAAGRAFIKRLEQRTENRAAKISVKAFRTQLEAVKRWAARRQRTCQATLHRHSSPTATTIAWSPQFSAKTCTAHPEIATGRLPQFRPRRPLPVPP
ncbi:hypothetical protein ACIO14_24635 [Nocardia fluminea]|uniref:hypothetical protein n=1 Tax=Nocardia fluminea TaxID=134984 RepID=UPI00381E5CAC